MEAARIGLAGRYLNEGTRPGGGWIRFAVVVRSPAQDVATGGLDATDVIPTAAELNEGLVFGRRGNVAPARDGTGGSQRAAVGGAGGDLIEDARGGVGLALIVVAPAAHGTTTSDTTSIGQGAGEVVPCAHGGFVVRTGGGTAIYREAPSNRFIATILLINNPAATTPRTNGIGLLKTAQKAKQCDEEGWAKQVVDGF